MTMNIRVGITPRRLNPKASTTPLALRRICGVCRHFAGDGIAMPGQCARFGADVHGRAGADRCEEWGRRTAGVDAPALISPVHPAERAAQVVVPDKDAPCDVAEAPVPAAQRRGSSRHAHVDTRRVQLRALAAEGKTMREAAAILGVGIHVVKSDAQVGKITFPRTSDKLRRPNTVQRNPGLRAELVTRIAAGGPIGSVREIAARHGVKIQTVYAMAARIRREVQG